MGGWLLLGSSARVKRRIAIRNECARVLANSQDALSDIGSIHRDNVRVVEGDQGQEPIREMSDIHSF